MKKFIITEDVLQQLVNYLSIRPYREVSEAMNILGTLEELPKSET